MRNKTKTKTKNNSSPIPRKLHFIWLGPKHPPYLSKFMRTFKKYAQGFTIRLWGEKDITPQNFPKTYTYIRKIQKYQGEKIKEYSGQKTMYRSNQKEYTYSKFAQISDLMRYEIVYNEGGYYFDANMFLIKDITDLFQRKEKFVGCNELGTNISRSPILSNSFFGAIPKSPILKRLLSQSFLEAMDLKTLDVDFVTGPGALRYVLKPSKDNYYIFPPNTFYPYILPWTPDGGDHSLRKSSKPKCTGPKKTKKRTLKMKPNMWLEFPCKQYPKSYGIKVWESGGSWSRPDKWYEKEGSNYRSVYAGGGKVKQPNGKVKQPNGKVKQPNGKVEQTGGVAPCVPCAAAVVSNPIGMAVGAAGVCVYGVRKIYKKLTKKKGKKSKSKSKKSKSKKSKSKKPKSKKPKSKSKK